MGFMELPDREKTCSVQVCRTSHRNALGWAWVRIRRYHRTASDHTVESLRHQGQADSLRHQPEMITQGPEPGR